ncbi:hypothetical protein ACH5RR_019569 [Cinchona calisaya]|uniref:SHSP domain-containing protein n=1 Tax=Cinchona calisaya TaxID=153742 RepID=A0ABD2ZPR0_9GENT
MNVAGVYNDDSSGNERLSLDIDHRSGFFPFLGEKESSEDEGQKMKFSSRFDLLEKIYKTNEIKAEMKNGVLKVFVPKIKEKEMSEVYHINVE